MDSTNSPTFAEIERVLSLQERAYETLRWLDNLSLARPQMLDQSTSERLRQTVSCMAWVEQHHGQIPSRLRPAPGDEEIFARLFSSFFQTSFRIAKWFYDGLPYYRIQRNRDQAGGKKKLSKRIVPRRLVRKRRDEAERLKINALRLLDQASDETSFSSQALVILDLDGLKQDILMWTYTCELIHRAHAESHGPAAHVLWKQMEKSTRDRLSAYRVWKARQRLIGALARQLTK